MKKIISTFEYLSSTYEYGTMLLKINISIILSIFTSTIVFFTTTVKGYFIKDASFVVLMVFLMFADALFGMIKHYKLNNFSFKDLFFKFMIKLIMTFISMAIFNSFSEIKDIDSLGIDKWISLLGRLITFFYVAGSIFNNMFIVSSGKFPPIGWMNKMKNFNETLDINIFKKDSIETEKIN